MSFSGLLEVAPGRRLFVQETAPPPEPGAPPAAVSAAVPRDRDVSSEPPAGQAARNPSETSTAPGAPRDRTAHAPPAGQAARDPSETSTAQPTRDTPAPPAGQAPRNPSPPPTAQPTRDTPAPPAAQAARDPSDASAVLLLHGFTGSTHSMASLVPMFSDRFRVLSVDLLGHGRSDAPREPSAYRMQNCSADLAAVLRARKVKRVHIIGYSLGARIALALALAEPQRTLSLTMIGGRAGIYGIAERARRREADEALAQRIEREGMEWFADYWAALPLFSTQRTLGAEALAEMRRRRLQCRPHGLAASLRGIGPGAQPPLFAALSCLCAPVLLVTGEYDPRFGEVARELMKRLPRSQHVELERVGHAAHLESPEAFKRAALRFIEAAEEEHSVGNGGRSSAESDNTAEGGHSVGSGGCGSIGSDSADQIQSGRAVGNDSSSSEGGRSNEGDTDEGGRTIENNSSSSEGGRITRHAHTSAH